MPQLPSSIACVETAYSGRRGKCRLASEVSVFLNYWVSEVFKSLILYNWTRCSWPSGSMRPQHCHRGGSSRVSGFCSPFFFLSEGEMGEERTNSILNSTFPRFRPWHSLFLNVRFCLPTPACEPQPQPLRAFAVPPFQAHLPMPVTGVGVSKILKRGIFFFPLNCVAWQCHPRPEISVIHRFGETAAST